MGYDRATFRTLAELRLAEARRLHADQHWSGAYYLCGYVVECALKACIAKNFRAEEIPDRALVNSIYQHNLTNLLRLAGLQEGFDLGGLDMRERWAVVSKWSEHARYEICAPETATAMVAAVDGEEGVFRWLTNHW